MIAVTIASHGRISIVEQNLTHLLSMNVEVFLCLTDAKERDYLQKLFPKVHFTIAPNYPLGAKWQSVINLARTKNPDYLITCGSDDFLSTDYVDNCIKLTYRGFEFVSVNGWYLTDGKKHYRAKYKHLTHFPAGSGRFFTREALDKINYSIFDTKANRLLDDNVLQMVHERKVKTYISQEAEKDGLLILAAKGKWEQLNPLSKFLNAPSIKIEKVKELPSVFPTIKF